MSVKNEVQLPTTGLPSSDISGTNNQAIKRRSVACKSCHSLKVKCTPLDPDNLSGPCVRCSKANRKCEIDLSQPRRRKRKTSPSLSSVLSEHKLTTATRQQQQQQKSTQQQKQQADISKDQSTVSELELLQQRVKFLEKELLAHRQKSYQPNYNNHQQPPSNIPHQYLQSYSSPPKTTNGYNYHSHQQQQQQQQYQQKSPNTSLFATPHSHTSGPQSPYPVSLPPLQRPNSLQSEYIETPMNVEVTTEEIMDTDDQVQELQNELNLLMRTQKATLSQLTSDVLKVADKRTDLIHEKYGFSKYDCVELGYITLEELEERLRLYREVIYPLYPFVEIPEEMSAEEMRKAYRFLFTTVITVTALLIPKDSPALENQMDIDLCNMRLITTEVLIIGNKTLELLKCLMLLSLWYNSAELFHHRRYHLINSLCVSMVHDLGLTGRPYFFYNKEERSVKKTEASENPKGLEYRRLLLTVYFTSISISLFLRRRIQVNWTPYLQECCEILENTGEKGDLKIAILSRLNRMLERIHFIVHGNQEPTDSAFMQPDRLKYITSELQKDLSEIKLKISRSDHCLISYYYSVQAYLHEPALQKIFAGQNFNSVPPGIISSIDKCSRSCIAALEQQKLTSLEDMTVMPLLHSSRIIYTAGMLLRLRYLVISVPSLSTSTHFPRDAIEKIQLLATSVYNASQQYPSNNFLHKMRLVIALFSQTYSTQLQKLIDQKLQNKQAPTVKWDRDDDILSLHILSQAAALARNEGLKNTSQARPVYLSSKNDLSSNGITSNFIANHPALSESTVISDGILNNGTNNSDLEFSYYALNDEFWSDLLLNNENDTLLEISGHGPEVDHFDHDFI